MEQTAQPTVDEFARLKHLVADKSEGHVGALSLLARILAQLQPVETEMFCEQTPNGRDLYADYLTRQEAAAKPREYNEVAYTREVLAKHLPTYLAPKSCLLDPEARRPIANLYLSQYASLGPAGMLAGHREQQPYLDGLKAIICQGCGIRECRHCPR